MAASDRFQKLQEEIKHYGDVLLPIDKGAVFIRDPRKRRDKGAVFIRDPRKRRKCPLCRKNLYLYYLNYEEMFLMCESSSCDFPFGYEAIQIVRQESDLVDCPVKASTDFFEYPTDEGRELPRSLESILGGPTCTTMSTMSCISESDGLSQVGDTDDLPMDKQDAQCSRLNKQELKRRSMQERDKSREMCLNRIKELTEEMYRLGDVPELESEGHKVITNKKWLKTFKLWEAETGRKLLKDEENLELTKDEGKRLESGVKISVGEACEPGAQPNFSIQILGNAKEATQQGTEGNDDNK